MLILFSLIFERRSFENEVQNPTTVTVLLRLVCPQIKMPLDVSQNTFTVDR